MTTYSITTQAHTDIMRITARLEETRAYIRNFEETATTAELKTRAWEGQWFGFIPESIFIRLMPALYNRYGQYPQLMEVLKKWLSLGLESHDFKLICHLHLQLTDPYYRWVSGQCLPSRYREGLYEINNTILVSLLKNEIAAELKSNSLQKLARNILTTIRDVGLLKGTQNKSMTTPVVSVEFLGYLLYTLSKLGYPVADIPASPYIQSLFRDRETFQGLLAEGQRKNWWEYNWGNQIFTLSFQYPDILTWFERSVL
ncbi:BrxA family protein [Deltaproteobacteria bacterium TL4]